VLQTVPYGGIRRSSTTRWAGLQQPIIEINEQPDLNLRDVQDALRHGLTLAA
jgi:hypothetical protein